MNIYINCYYKIVIFFIIIFFAIVNNAIAQDHLFYEIPPEKASIIDNEKVDIMVKNSCVKRHRIALIKKDVFKNEGDFVFNFFNDKKINVSLKKVDLKGVKDMWNGKVEGDQLSEVQIFYHEENGSLNGRIITGNQFYSLLPIDDGVVLIQDLDASKLRVYP